MATNFDPQIESVEASGDRHESITQPSNDSGIGGDDDARAFKEWVALRRSLRIVVTGKTGAGKSTLLNGFIGGKTRPFREGGGFDPETLEVEQYTFTKHNVEVTVWDCPGLQDGTQNEEAYLEDLKNKTNGDIDVMLYCISMEDTRFDRQCHGAAMQHLTQAFGHRIWRHTVIVLTFANCQVRRLKKRQSNVDEEFEKKVREWKTKIQSILHELKCTDKPSDSVIEQIQVVPAGFKTPSLPGRKFWLSDVWIAIFATLKTEEAKAAVVALNEHRFRTDPEQEYPSTFTDIAFGGSRRSSAVEVERPPPVTDEDFKNKDIEDQPIVISPDMEKYLHKVGAEIVAISSIGVVAGATLGGIIAGAASLGIGAPVGAGVGGLIGGGVGFIMSSLFRAYKHRKAKARLTPGGQTDAAGIDDEELGPPSSNQIANESPTTSTDSEPQHPSIHQE
jgi:GTPase SAR1 family protein